MLSYQRTTSVSSAMSSPEISPAASIASSETNPMPRRVPSAESLPPLTMTGTGSQASSTTASDDLSEQAEDVLATPMAAVSEGPAETIRGTTALSMALHGVVEEPLHPLSMWMENTDNSRLERLLLGLSKEPTANPAIERWLADTENSRLERISMDLFPDSATTAAIERWLTEDSMRDFDAAFASEAITFPLVL